MVQENHICQLKRGFSLEGMGMVERQLPVSNRPTQNSIFFPEYELRPWSKRQTNFVPVVKNGIDINIRAARVLCNVSIKYAVQCVLNL